MPRRIKWSVEGLEAHLGSFEKTLEECRRKGTTLNLRLYGLSMRVAPIVRRIIQERYDCYYKLEECRGDIEVIFYPKTKRLDQAQVRKELGREEVAHARSRDAASQEYSTQGVRRSSMERE